MKNKFSRLTFIFFTTLPLTLVSLLSCNDTSTEKNIKKKGIKEITKDAFAKKDTIDNKDTINNKEIAVAPPPFSPGIFPCSKCHAKHVSNSVRRKLAIHQSIDSSFTHDQENRWCLDCHYAQDRDYLVLASGKLLSFKESYKLCGQCHGDKYRDWKVGVHGKRTGLWNGNKKYLLCVSCHNPHSPKFSRIKPLPPPVKQEDIIDLNN